MLSTNTKMTVYQACVLSTLLYGSEAWTLYSHQERRLRAFHLRCLRRLLGTTWRDRVTNIDVLAKAGIPSMFAILTKRRLRWLGHVTRMDDRRIPIDMLFRELATGTRHRSWTPSPPLQEYVQARPESSLQVASSSYILSSSLTQPFLPFFTVLPCSSVRV
ncbi:uncharacterized protein LOC125034556 [Penaeus chinensis]|uniref:uncharacterized protein LOC125034556 n=1 Tax=Penaeus chinensis TaxID=139456 RepID=UPI001FB73BDD|nr:uncharacterized protein LOC125034556 [Penaeus chinensis]